MTTDDERGEFESFEVTTDEGTSSDATTDLTIYYNMPYSFSSTDESSVEEESMTDDDIFISERMITKMQFWKLHLEVKQSKKS